MEEKGKLNYETMMYIGKQWNKNFSNDDSTTTKSYKYQFKKNENSMFPTNFWGYDTTKGADTLEEGKEYVIGFIHKPNSKGDKPIKVARFFGIPKNKIDVPNTELKKNVVDSVDVVNLVGDNWINELLDNYDTFKELFVDKQNGYNQFTEWLNNPEQSSTDVFLNMDSELKKVAMKSTYEYLLQKGNDVV